MRRTLSIALLFVAISSISTPSTAQITSTTPTKTTRLVVPYPPGGPLDTVARALAEKTKEQLGTVIVENRPGAGGNIGADLVAKAAPDGATLVMGAVATHAINPWLYAKIPYDALRDFTPITLVAVIPNVLVMNTDAAKQLNITSVQDLINYTRKNPGKLNYGSGGNGSAGHLAGEMFKAQAKVSMVHIPYTGGPAAQMGLLAGDVHVNFDNIAAASANIRAGKVKALAVTTPKRSSAMPELPALSETLAGFDISTWFGIFAPAKLSAENSTKLNKAFVEALNTADMRERLGKLMAEPAPTTAAQFAQFVQAENAKYERVVKATGAKVD
jgi:tripartite-type tricarboxylate transporter receptor subunit TctC